jgi:hypothetical protein
MEEWEDKRLNCQVVEVGKGGWGSLHTNSSGSLFFIGDLAIWF